MLLDVFTKQAQIHIPIRVAIQDELARISTLSNMVHDINGYHTRKSCHAGHLAVEAVLAGNLSGTRRWFRINTIRAPQWRRQLLGEIERRIGEWSGRRDSNPRPSAPKADALPGCATPRHALSIVSRIRFGVVPADPNIATIEELRPSKLNQQVEPVSSAGCRQWLQPAGPRKCLDANLLISRPWLVQFGQEF